MDFNSGHLTMKLHTINHNQLPTYRRGAKMLFFGAYYSAPPADPFFFSW